MKIFSKLKNTTHNTNTNSLTTKGFCIGVPEAEAEATTSNIKLDCFYEDYLNILEDINNEKFIILGRKGTGKTALGEYILSLANNDANTFCDFIKKNEIDIEHIVQIGKEEGYTIEKTLLYKWIILTKFISLFIENQSLASQHGMKHLSDFINKNRGFVNVNNYDVKEVIKSYGLNVNVEYFKRYLNASGNANIQYKYEKAEFYKLIPDLEKVVVDILKKDTQNDYILMFDDLDINLNVNNNDSIDSLIELIRIVKNYNNDIFARNKIESKIIIFLRNDIQKHLIYTADMPKIFQSYSLELRWYEDIYRNNEKKLQLRKFINKRIQVNFNNKEYVINDHNDPWTSYVDERSFEGGKTGFKYIIDHTFFRPRDLILFFKDLGSLDLNLPLSADDINTILMARYVVNMVTDIKGELSVSYSIRDIELIFKTLCDCFDKNRTPFSYCQIIEKLRQYGLSDDAEKIVSDLYDYSLIGNYNCNGNVSFKFREQYGQTITMQKNEKFILHYLLHAYFKIN